MNDAESIFGDVDETFPLPRLDQRVAIIGPEGSGKSILMRDLLTNYPTFIIVDAKRDWSWGAIGKADPKRFRYMSTTVDGVRKILEEIRRNNSTEHVVYRPAWAHVRDGTVDRIALLALQRRNTGLCYDEAEAVTRYDKYIEFFEQAVMQGRSLCVPVWCGTKRPTRVPLNILAASNARFIFNLRMAHDRVRAEEICGGDSIPWDQLRKEEHSFIYSDDRETIGPLRVKTEDFH